MFRIVYRLPFLCLVLLSLVLIQAAPCQARDISVELVWKLGQAGWVEINVENGDYQLNIDSVVQPFPTGSILQVGWGGWGPILRVNHEEYHVFRGSTVELKPIHSGSLRIKTPEGKTAVYRGSFQLRWQSDHWQLINRIDQEEYLKGVVPIEMSNEWAKSGLEALKAQAVAARTYVVKHTENNQAITDSPDIDQAYAGQRVEGDASKAVEATRGEILGDTQTQQPIDALYSSHNGGYTEDAKNVWGNSDPHYTAHPDPYSQGVGGPEDHWRFIVSAPILGSTFGLGPVQKVELDKFPSGRVKKVRMEDCFGHSQTVTGRAFVKAFYPFGQPIRTMAFLGSLFEVEARLESSETTNKYGFFALTEQRNGSRLQDANVKESAGPYLSKIISSAQGVRTESQPFGAFIFEGRGWGHGVGMSQWGAYHMAQLGYGYKDILMFYYDHASLLDLK